MYFFFFLEKKAITLQLQVTKFEEFCFSWLSKSQTSGTQAPASNTFIFTIYFKFSCSKLLTGSPEHYPRYLLIFRSYLEVINLSQSTLLEESSFMILLRKFY